MAGTLGERCLECRFSRLPCLNQSRHLDRSRPALDPFIAESGADAVLPGDRRALARPELHPRGFMSGLYTLWPEPSCAKVILA